MIFQSSYLLPPTISLIKFTLKLNQNRIRNTRVNSHFCVTDWYLIHDLIKLEAISRRLIRITGASFTD